MHIIPSHVESIYSLSLTLMGAPTFLTIIVGAFFARNVAGKFDSREMITLLSYPVKRLSVILSKFLINFLTFYVVAGSILFLDAILLGLNPLEPAPYISLLVLLINLLFICSVALTVSLLLKRGAMAALCTYLLLYGLELVSASIKAPYNGYFSQTLGGNIMFDYMIKTFYPIYAKSFEVAPKVFFSAFLFQFLTSILLLLGSFIYFQRIMQLD